MKTVKEVSNLTGISVRTLHYYDEIGLLKPTGKSEAGYRLYDDKALETLQQVLFFREFDIPLKEIKVIMADPARDRNQILQMQREMLTAKKERMERLIASIDRILKGDNKMDFAIFDRKEIEEMFRQTYERMPEKIRQLAVDEFGGVEEWKNHYMDVVSSEDMQKKYAKMVEWYGGKEAYQAASAHPLGRDVAESYGRRIEAVIKKIAGKKNCSPDSFEVKELIGEYGFVMKQLTQVKEEAGMMKYLAWFQNSEPTKSKIDKQHGEGSAEFIAQAVEAFYGNE
ncbi:MAG: MerR family transcriptional regulator [Lachnospiraceae bacterium]|nr:MerR family transcriptional regulator [Lachnospiraceae bacterium]